MTPWHHATFILGCLIDDASALLMKKTVTVCHQWQKTEFHHRGGGGGSLGICSTPTTQHLGT